MAFARATLNSDDSDASLRTKFWRKLRRGAARVPFAEDLLAAYYCAFDRATPLPVKATLIGAIAYFILPFDAIPDFMPALGFTDDAAVLAAAIKLVASSITPAHHDAARENFRAFCIRDQRRTRTMDRATLKAYDTGAFDYAADWHNQPPPTDLHALMRRCFCHGDTADVGCGSGREVAWLSANGYPAIGYDPSIGLLTEARRRYPLCRFEQSELPGLSLVAPQSFDNVLCETVIMHLPVSDIALSVRRLIEILKVGGTLYVSWRVTKDADLRDSSERLYSAFDAELVRGELTDAEILLDEEAISASSGKIIHRIVARR